MHDAPSEASVLRDLLEKEINASLHAKDNLLDILAELDIYCDVSNDRILADHLYCNLHGVTFRDHEDACECPVGKFAQELKKKYE